MKIIEQFIKGKYNEPDLCEDAICVTDDFIAVIDGVTSQSDFRYENKKLGRIINEILMKSIPKLDISMDCYQAIDFLNECVIKYYKDKGFYDKIAGDPANQPAASVIMYSKKYRQIWLIGDCMALYGDRILSNELELDKLYEQIRIMILKYLLETGYTEKEMLQEDLSKKYIQDLNKRHPYLRNRRFYGKYDYVVIDGFNKPDKDLIKIVDVPKEVDKIVFTSDGYRKPFETLKEAEEDLKIIRQQDPLRYKKYPCGRGLVPGQDGFDDRTYISFEI